MSVAWDSFDFDIEISVVWDSFDFEIEISVALDSFHFEILRVERIESSDI